jgi:hypothetical protein
VNRAEYAAFAAGIAAVLSALAAMFTAARQGRLNRQLVRLQAINIERREFREGLLVLSATSRVVAERGRELTSSAKANGTVSEIRSKFEAFSAASEYLLQSWAGFSSRVAGREFREIRESIARILEASEATRLGWLVLSTGGPPSTAHAMAGYADTASQWSMECQQMCAVGAQASGVLVETPTPKAPKGRRARAVEAAVDPE